MTGSAHSVPVLAVVFLVLLTLVRVAGAEGDGTRYAGRPLAEALLELQEQGLDFLFSSELVRVDMRVVNEPQSVVPERVLEELLRPHGLGVQKGPGGLLAVVELVDPGPQTPARGGLRGSVRCGETGRRLMGVAVRIVEADREVVTGPEGAFWAPGLAAGTYTVEAALQGYVGLSSPPVLVRAGDVTEIALQIQPIPVALEEIVVTPGRFSTQAEPIAGPALEDPEFEGLPQLGDDLFRVLARLPGMASSERRPRLNIRGGRHDEVLILLDGVELFESFHLSGLATTFSSIDSSLIGRAEVLTGTFPVEYGDRMSGVIDLSTRMPDGEPELSVTVGTINLRLGGAGGFEGDRGRWLVSGRHWHPDRFIDVTDPHGETLEPTYYDLLAKVRYLVGDRTVLTGSIFHANDKLDFRNSGEALEASTNSHHLWLTLERRFGGKFFSRSLLSGGNLKRFRRGGFAAPYEESYQIDDRRGYRIWTLQQDWSWAGTDRHSLRWGFKASRARAKYRYRLDEFYGDRPADSEHTSVHSLDSTPEGKEYGLYVAHRSRPVPRLTLETGLRWDRQSYLPRGGSQLSPRLSLALGLGETTTLRAGWGRYHQSQELHQLQVEDGETSFFRPQLATHLSLGLERHLGRDLSLRVEGYRKSVARPRPRYENLLDPFGFFPEAETDRVRLAPEKGLSRGLEVSMRRRGAHDLTWWASYVLSVTEDRLDGAWVPRSWDQTHAVSFSVNYRWREAWSFNLAGIAHSGWPTTSIAVGPALDGDQEATVPVLGSRNDDRLPGYIRFDLRVLRRFETARGTFRPFLEISNLFDRQNVCCVADYGYVAQPDGSIRREFGRKHWLPLVPSIGLGWSN